MKNILDLDYLKSLEKKINKEQQEKQQAQENKERHVVNTSILGSNEGYKDIFSTFKADEEESKKIKEYAESKGYDMRSLSEIEIQKIEKEMRSVRVNPIVNTDKIDESILLELDDIMAEEDNKEEISRDSTIYVKEPVQPASINEINKSIDSNKEEKNEIITEEERPKDILVEEVKDDVTIDSSSDWKLDDIDLNDAFENKSLTRLNDILAKEVDSKNTVVENIEEPQNIGNIKSNDENITEEEKRKIYENTLQDRNKIGSEPSVLSFYNKEKSDIIPESEITENIGENGEQKLLIESNFKVEKVPKVGQNVSFLDSTESENLNSRKENIEFSSDSLNERLIVNIESMDNENENIFNENKPIEETVIKDTLNVNKESDKIKDTDNSILNKAMALTNSDDVEVLSVSEVIEEENKLDLLNKRLIEMRDKSKLDESDIKVIKDTLIEATETVKNKSDNKNNPLESLNLIKDIIQTKREEDLTGLDLDEIDWGELEVSEDNNPVKQQLLDIASLIKEQKTKQEVIEPEKTPLDLVLEELSKLKEEDIAIKYTNKDLQPLDLMEISNMGYNTYMLPNEDYIIAKSGNFEDTFSKRIYVGKFVAKLKEEVLNFFNNGIASEIPLTDIDGLPIFTKEELDKIIKDLSISIDFKKNGELNTALIIVGI